MDITQLVTVDLGIKKIKVPAAQIEGESEGPHLLITAGLDGDEYAGIEAAYRIIEEYGDKRFKGRLTIIPIVNICGFEKRRSDNPLDNKFPKHVLFPGKKDGSPTERLMYWLSNNYICNCDLWLDLHGGALDEWLPDPFIWTFETRNEKLNELVKKIIKVINVPKVVFERPNTRFKVEALANASVAYINSEAGFLGSRSKIFIEKHIEVAKSVMEVLGMKSKITKDNYRPRVYRKVEMYKAKYPGLWYPNVFKNSSIRKGEKLGEVRSYKGKLLEEAKSRYDGEYLWGREGLFCQKGDTLIGVGCEMMGIVDIK